MHGRHEAALDRECVVEDLRERFNASSSWQKRSNDRWARRVVASSFTPRTSITSASLATAEITTYRRPRRDAPVPSGASRASGRLDDTSTPISPGEVLGFGNRERRSWCPRRDRLRAGVDLDSAREPAEKRVELEQVGHRLRVAGSLIATTSKLGFALEIGTKEFLPIRPKPLIANRFITAFPLCWRWTIS